MWSRKAERYDLTGGGACRYWKMWVYTVRTHSPMNAAVAHNDVCGSQARAELGGHSEQPDSGSPAGCVLTGGSAATTDKTLHQTVELLQSIEGTHQLVRHSGRGAKSGSKRNNVIACQPVHVQRRTQWERHGKQEGESGFADENVLVVLNQADPGGGGNAAFTDLPWTVHWGKNVTSAF